MYFVVSMFSACFKTKETILIYLFLSNNLNLDLCNANAANRADCFTGQCKP